MIDKYTVRNNFSRYAEYYDRYSDIQKICASRLVERIDKKDFVRIMDVGCGTGTFTVLLKERFPAARIKAIDISPAMIEVARKKLEDKSVEFIAADTEKIEFEERFDLISSNASFQWIHDLEKALGRYGRMLEKGGSIYFSTFGPLTLCELDRALNTVVGRDKRIPARDFKRKEEIEDILNALFADAGVEEVIIKKRYASLMDLLNEIKFTGTKGGGIDRNLWTARTIERIEERCRVSGEDFIEATYQVFFCMGTKR